MPAVFAGWVGDGGVNWGQGVRSPARQATVRQRPEGKMLSHCGVLNGRNSGLWRARSQASASAWVWASAAARCRFRYALTRQLALQ